MGIEPNRRGLQLAPWNPGAGDGRFSGAEARACAADIRRRTTDREGSPCISMYPLGPLSYICAGIYLRGYPII